MKRPNKLRVDLDASNVPAARILERHRQANGFVAAAITGAMELTDHDPFMMTWPESEHEHVMAIVGRIRDGIKERS
jgi:hypothetical protein